MTLCLLARDACLDNSGAGALVALLRENQRDDETVQTQGLREDENQNHADEKLVLLTYSSHTCIADNANCHTSSQTTAEGKQR